MVDLFAQIGRFGDVTPNHRILHLILAIIAASSLSWHILSAVVVQKTEDRFLVLEDLPLQIAHRLMVSHQLLSRNSIDVYLLSIDQVK